MSPFYPHIALLRGVAILLIVLFHMNPAWCPQGYFGVDLFLVISGYLLIGRQLRAEAPFVLGRFVTGRVRRLLPPMLFVCALFGVVELVLMPRAEWKDYLAEMEAALTVRANVVLDAGTKNYFAVDTRAMPLMHLWYMSMLMQLYVIFAILFAGWSFFRCSLRGRLVSLLLLVVPSLAIQCRWLVYALGWGGVEWENSVYYWTSARLWEPALGGLLAALPATRGTTLSSALAWGSLALLVILALHPLPMSTHWIPVAVLLALLLVRYGASFTCRSRLMRGFLWLGSISFSLYLVHWPLISYTEYLFFEPLTWVRACVVLPVAVLLVGCCYRWGEQRQYTLRWVGVVWCCCIVFCIAVRNAPRMFGSLMTKQGAPMVFDAGLPVSSLVVEPSNSPLYQGTEALESQRWSWENPDESILMHIGRGDAPACFAVVGDSHALRFFWGMNQIAPQRGWSGVFINCYFRPYYGTGYYADKVGASDYVAKPEQFEALEDYLRQQRGLKTLIVGQYWMGCLARHRLWNGQWVEERDCLAARLEQLRTFCERIHRCGTEVLFLTPTPWVERQHIVRLMRWKQRYASLNPEAAAIHLSREEYDQKARPVLDLLEQLQREGKCRLLHVEESFFDDGVFEPVQDGQMMLCDAHHLTAAGAAKCVRGVAEELDAYCRAPQPEPTPPSEGSRLATMPEQ